MHWRPICQHHIGLSARPKCFAYSHSTWSAWWQGIHILHGHFIKSSIRLTSSASPINNQSTDRADGLSTVPDKDSRRDFNCNKLFTPGTNKVNNPSLKKKQDPVQSQWPIATLESNMDLDELRRLIFCEISVGYVRSRRNIEWLLAKYGVLSCWNDNWIQRRCFFENVYLIHFP